MCGTLPDASGTEIMSKFREDLNLAWKMSEILQWPPGLTHEQYRLSNQALHREETFSPKKFNFMYSSSNQDTEEVTADT